MRLTVNKNGFFGNKVILDMIIPYSISPDSWYKRDTYYISEVMNVDRILFGVLRSKNIDVSQLKFTRSEGDDLVCKYTFVDSKNVTKYTATLAPGSEWCFMSDYVEYRCKTRIAKGKIAILDPFFWRGCGYDDYDNLLDKIEIVVNNGSKNLKRIEDLNDQIHFTYATWEGLSNMARYVEDNHPSDEGVDTVDRKLFMSAAYESVMTKPVASIKVIGNEDGKTKLAIVLGGKYKSFCLKRVDYCDDAAKILSKDHEEVLADLNSDAISLINKKTMPITFYVVQVNGNLIPLEDIGRRLMDHNNSIEKTLNEWEQKRIKAARGSQKDKKEYYNYLEQMLGESWKNSIKYWGYGAEIGEPCVAGYIKDEERARNNFHKAFTNKDYEQDVARRIRDDEECFEACKKMYEKLEDEEWMNNCLQDLD